MNKKLKVGLWIAAISVTSLYAADGLIGTENDPVVTKSYVDKLFAGMSGSSNKDLEASIAAQDKLISQLSMQISQLQQANSGYEIVTVQAGSTIYGKQGSEIIIRSGQGVIVASAAGGVQDVTDGVDLSGGVNAPNNNLLLIPREDGRGIQAVKTMVVMVRGGYTLG